MAVVKDLGAVTAYAYAVAAGYTGTEAQFQTALGESGSVVSDLQNLQVVAVQVAAGGQPTASYANGVLTIGIPKGDKGDKGDPGSGGGGGGDVSRVEFEALRSDVDDLDEIINGSDEGGGGGGGGGGLTPLTFTFEDGFYIEATTGRRYAREDFSWSDFVAVPAGATELTIRASSNLNAAGYCFYTKANISYPIADSGGRMRVTGDIVNEVVAEVPPTATHIALSTLTVDKGDSGIWSGSGGTPVPSGGGTGGILGKLDAIDTNLSPCIDKAGLIEWEDGKRIIRTYGIYETSGYRLGRFHASKGDIVTIDHISSLPKSVVQIAEAVSIVDTVAHRPVTPEKSMSHVEYVVPEDMDLVISVKTSDLMSVKWMSMPVLGKAIGYDQNQSNMFPWSKIHPLMVAMSTAPMNKGSRVLRPLVLAHISDIHNSRQNAASFKKFLDLYGNHIDAAIVTGDMAGSRYTDYVPVFAEEGYNKILLTIGNHDVYDHNGDAPSENYDERQYFATPLETYNKYFAPSIANWRVTQPEYAAEEGSCYYYRDFDLTGDVGGGSSQLASIRLIVLDPMHYDMNQHSWLGMALLGARQMGGQDAPGQCHVIIANHFIPIETTDPDDIQQFDTAFASKMPGMRDYYGLYFLSFVSGSTRYKAADLVDEHINAGGTFVCWLCGHMHFDMVGTLASHPNQIFVAVGSDTAYPGNAYSDMPREYGEKSENIINIVSVDRYHSMLRVARVGAEYDEYMRHRGAMCIDYANRRLVDSW